MADSNNNNQGIKRVDPPADHHTEDPPPEEARIAITEDAVDDSPQEESKSPEGGSPPREGEENAAPETSTAPPEVSTAPTEPAAPPEVSTATPEPNSTAVPPEIDTAPTEPNSAAPPEIGNAPPEPNSTAPPEPNSTVPPKPNNENKKKTAPQNIHPNNNNKNQNNTKNEDNNDNEKENKNDEDYEDDTNPKALGSSGGIRRKDKCCCNWKNCAQLQKQLFDYDVWKGLVAISNVSGALQQCLCRNLGAELDEPPQRFVIAKHHWPRALIEQNAAKNRRWTTPLSLLEASRYLHIVDKRDSFHHPTSGETMYCQAPGVPLHVVEQACWEDEEDDGHKEAARQLKNRNDIIEKLLKENARLSNHMKKFKDTAHESGKQIKKLEKIKSLSASPHWISTNTLLEFLNNHYGGLTRYTIQSDEWHANNPNAAKELFGYPTWEATKQSIAEQFPSLVEKGPLETPPRIFQSKKGVLQLDDVSEFEKCLCVKLMDRTGLTKSRAALLMGRQDRTVTYWRQAWCPQWGISRDGLEQSKHKAHLNQATRKGPTAAQRKKKALASSAANEAKKRKTNNDSSNNMPTAAENDAMAFLPGGLPPSQLMQQHHDIPGLSQLTGLSAHHLGGMGGEEHQQQHSHLQQQQHQQPQPPPGLTLNFHPHQGFPGNFALQQPFQHYIQQAPIPPHHPQPQQQQQQQPGQQQQQQQPPGHHGQQQQQQLQDDAAAAMAAAAGVLPKNQRRGQNMYYGL